MSDHDDFEPAYGLPELLPTGERMLWQGSPRWRAVARNAMHLKGISVYFGILLVWKVASAMADGASVAAAAASAAPLSLLAVVAIGLLLLLAWLIERTTIYTVTDRRIVMRIGVVLSITFNLPYSRIEAAGLRVDTDGTGDIPLQLAGEDRIAFVHLWPHMRPWKVARTQPMLRAIPDAARVATLIGNALAKASGMPATAVPLQPIERPVTAAGHGRSREPQAA